MLLLLRHAERQPWAGVDTVGDLLLVEKGKRHSEEFGKKLRKVLDDDLVFLSSYPPRCTETAMYIAMGYGLKKLRHLLVDHDRVFERFWMPGKKEQVVSETKAAHSFSGMPLWKKGLLKGAYPYKEYVKRCEEVLDRVYNQYCKEEGVSLIAVTHDITLVPFSWCYAPDAFPSNTTPYLAAL